MSRTINSGVTGPVTLNTATDNPLTITSTGTVTSTGAGNDGIDGSGANWTVGNSGTVSSGSADGFKLSGGATLTNNAGGVISSAGTIGGGLGVGAALYITGGSGSVTNNGAISGGAYGAALGGGGSVTNTSSITGGEDAIRISGGAGTISNTGTITGTSDDAIGLFGGGSITNSSGATISSTGTAGAAVYTTGGATNVTNSGNVSSSNHGFLIEAGGTVTNNTLASITAVNAGVFFKVQPGTVNNSGNISGTGTSGTGVYLENNGNITNTSTGTITGAVFGAFIEGGGGTISNSGSISGTGFDGVVLGMGGMVVNNTSGHITGGSTGVYVKYRAAGTVTNSGSIAGTATSSTGVDLAAGGSLANNMSGSITGNTTGVFSGSTAATGSAAATISNAGNILGVSADGVDLSKGGSVTNLAGGTITGGSNGVYVNTGSSGTVTNSGSITATTSPTGAGVDLGGGGSVTNNTGGSISGGGFGVFATGALATVTNNASISGSHGVGFAAGGSVTNNASGSITGQVAGVQVLGGAGTLVNTGHITATGGAGADIEGGGSVTNNVGGNITGSTIGVFMSGSANTVTNAGTITGPTYAIDFTGSGTNRLIVDPTAVFAGKVAANSTAANTLELASGTGSIGGLGGVGASFANFQTLAVDAGGSWTLTGANTTTSVLDAGSLDLAGTLNNSATIAFQGGTSQLLIDNAATFGSNVGTPSYTGPQLQDFIGGDKVDLKNISSLGATLSYNASTGLLEVTNSLNQVATLDFQNSSLGSGSFELTSDGGAGTFVALAPGVTSITTSGTGISNGNGDLGVGKLVTFTVNFSQAVTVNTSGGSPTLSLNDNGSASYVGGSGSTALTFSYTVAAGQNTSDLTVSSFNTNGATVQNGTTAADLSGATNSNPAGILRIDTTPPVVTISNTGGTVSQAAQTITGTVDVADAGSTVAVFDGSTQVGTAIVQSTGSWSTGVTLTSGTNTLTADDTDAAGNVGVSNTVTYTLTPGVTSITTSGTGISNGNGDLGVGKLVTFTVNFSQAVTVNTSGGSPTLSLNDNGSASYVGGSGSTALTFSYTVAAGQNTSDLTVSSFNTNGATVQNGTTAADLSGATNSNPAGILQIDTTPPVVTISNTGGTVSQAARTITGTVDVADAGSTITVFDGSTQVGTAIVQSSGSWSTGVTLTSGTNTLTADDTDAAGNVGVSNTVTYTLTSPPDVQWQNGLGGLLAVWSMNGAQAASSNTVTFQGSQAVPDATWSVAGLGDFNGDGTNGFLWRNQNGTLVDWTMSGSQITSSQTVTFGGSPAVPNSSWNVAGIGDFNGDGKDDVLWRNTNGSLVDWTMNGSQVTASQQVTLGGGAATPNSSWSVAGIGDFSGDGKADVLWRNTNGSLIDWTMNGSQIASVQAVTLGGSAATPDSSWSVAGIGDFNGDGKADVLWRNTNGTLIDWTMNGSQITNEQQVTFGGSPVSLSSSWQIAQIGDFNGNGASDILLRNTNGAMVEWSMNGAQIASSSQVTLQGNPVTPPNSWNTLSKPTDFV